MSKLIKNIGFALSMFLLLFFTGYQVIEKYPNYLVYVDKYFNYLFVENKEMSAFMFIFNACFFWYLYHLCDKLENKVNKNNLK